MIKNLTCFIIGHKYIYKVFSGKTVNITGIFGSIETIPTYETRKSNFCLRCGKNRN